MQSTTEVRTNGQNAGRLIRSWPVPSAPWASVLIVHGLGEHSGRYDDVGSQMAEAGLEVRSFDLPGFGQSSGRRAYVDDFDELLDAVAEELAPLLVKSVPSVLLGHSLGGLIADRYVRTQRPQPDLLVLSSPALGANTPAWQRALAPFLAKVAPKLSIPNPIAGEALSRDPAVAEAYFADPLVITSATTKLGAEMFRVMAESDPTKPFPMPCLIIHGGADPLVPPASSAALAQHSGVNRTLYPALRHECFNEPEGPEVVADVISWIRSQVT